MPAFFFDTSAVVKRYILEPGTGWIRALCEARDPKFEKKVNSVFISEITIVEGAAAFALLIRRGVISKREGEAAYSKFLEDADSEYHTVRLTPVLVRASAELTQRHPLKAYDAMQLAFGLHANALLQANGLSLVFITADDTLLQAARVEELAIENPFDHRDLDATT